MWEFGVISFKSGAETQTMEVRRMPGKPMQICQFGIWYPVTAITGPYTYEPANVLPHLAFVPLPVALS